MSRISKTALKELYGRYNNQINNFFQREIQDIYMKTKEELELYIYDLSLETLQKAFLIHFDDYSNTIKVTINFTGNKPKQSSNVCNDTRIYIELLHERKQVITAIKDKKTSILEALSNWYYEMLKPTSAFTDFPMEDYI